MHVLTERGTRDDLDQLGEAWASPESFILAPRRGRDPEFVASASARVPAAIARDHFGLLTSGSTGLPTLVVGARERAERLARTLHELQDAEPVAETILCLPLSYSYAFVNQWLWAHCHGRRLVPTSGLSAPDELGQALATASDAMICLVGVQVPLLRSTFARAQFPGVIRVHFAGGRFPQERLDEVAALFPRARVYNNYGCAEALPRLTLRRAEAATSAAHVGWPGPVASPEVDPTLPRSEPPPLRHGLVDDDGQG